MAQNNSQRPFFKKSYEDALWLRQQPAPVNLLWEDCAMADPYGDENGKELKTDMKRSTFFKAKKILEDNGMFRFVQLPGLTDARKTRWFVTNLHGARVKEYWAEQSLAGDSNSKDESLAGEGKSLAGEPTSLTGDYKSSETLSLNSSLPSQDLNKTTTDPDAAVFSFSVSSPQQSPDLPANPVAPETVELNKDLPASQPLCDSNKTNQIKVLSVSQSSVGKIPPTAHVKLNQNTPCSRQDAPQAPFDFQMSNPTPKFSNPPSSPFSLEVEEVLSRLKNSLESKGRLKEIELEKTLKSLKSYPEQTVLDAVSHCLERLDNIKNFGGYFRKALEGSYKPSQAKEDPKTTKISQEELKPGTAATLTAPKALEDFLSEENLELFLECKLEGRFLNLCIAQLLQEWDKGDEVHRSRIKYWWGDQKRSRVMQ